jgi:aminopeptidase N
MRLMLALTHHFIIAKTLSYFTEYFGIAYPLPKLDMVAIADFSAGAME